MHGEAVLNRRMVAGFAIVLPAARRGVGDGSGCCVGVGIWERRDAGLGCGPVDRFTGGWLQVIRRCLYSGVRERIARCVFVNKNHQRYALHLGKVGTVPVPPVASPFPAAHLPPVRYCVVASFVSC